MKGFHLLLLFLVLPLTSLSQTLYCRSFGNVKDHPIIFLHGGPGSSSVYFEATTAQLLADRGFFVVVYDRRGEGRSVDQTANMNFKEASRDLKQIYEQYNLKKASLLAFSFGGLVAAKFAEKHPEMIDDLILCSALVSQQKSYNTILCAVKATYDNRKDTARLKELDIIAKTHSNSLEYRTSVFKHASANGFFTLTTPSAHAKAIYNTYKTDPLIAGYKKNDHAVETFWQNESDRNIDVTPQLRALRKQMIPIYAMYGKQDGLYSKEQISEIRQLLGDSHVMYINNCSHTVFIDQQQIFLRSVTKWIHGSDPQTAP